MLNHIALHCVPRQIGWYFDKRDQRLCQNFYEAACHVARPVREIDIAFGHTPSSRAPSVQAATRTSANGFNDRTSSSASPSPGEVAHPSMRARY